MKGKRKIAILISAAVCALSCAFAVGCGETETPNPSGGDNKPDQGATQPEVKATEGLRYSLNADGKGYTLSGIGTATASEFVVAAKQGELQ